MAVLRANNGRIMFSAAPLPKGADNFQKDIASPPRKNARKRGSAEGAIARPVLPANALAVFAARSPAQRSVRPCRHKSRRPITARSGPVNRKMGKLTQVQAVARGLGSINRLS